MEKIIALIVAMLTVVGMFSLFVFADDGWTNAEVRFFDKSGAEMTPTEDTSKDWCKWQFVADGDPMAYDSHGEGHYVKAKISCDTFRVIFGSIDSNSHTNIEIYVDGSKIDSINPQKDLENARNVSSKEYKVTYGEHEITVKAGTPVDPGAWNGFVFTSLQYKGTKPSGEGEGGDDKPAETWIRADVGFFNSDGQMIEPKDGEQWHIFPWWKGADGSENYDSQSTGQYVRAEVNCSKFRIVFANADQNGYTAVGIYVDGKKIDTIDLTKDLSGQNPFKEYDVSMGKHEIIAKADEGGNGGFTFNSIQYIKSSGQLNPGTADETVAVSLLVLACAGITVSLKKRR